MLQKLTSCGRQLSVVSAGRRMPPRVNDMVKERLLRGHTSHRPAIKICPLRKRFSVGASLLLLGPQMFLRIW